MKIKNIFKKCDKYFSKIIYLLEFIISVFTAKLTYDIITEKVYNNIFAFNKIICLVIAIICIIFFIVYICRKHKKEIEHLFLVFVIPISVLYAVFVLPFNVPDEGTHILKAYDISQGNIFTKIDENGKSSCDVIKEFENYSNTRIQNYADLNSELLKETDYINKIEKISAAQANSPLLYMQNALAFKIGEILNLNIFYAIYLARLFSAIIFLILGYLAIKKIPFGKLVLAVALCMPMMIHQAASCSTDAVINSVLIYYISHIIYMVFKKDNATKKDKILLFSLTAIVGMFKYIYIIFAGILFITVFTKKDKRKEWLKTIGLMVLIGSIVVIGYYMFNLRYTGSPEAFEEYFITANINSEKQISYIMENKLPFIKTLAKEYITYGPDYIFEAVGSLLGWRNINVNIGVIIAYIILFIIAAVSEKNEYEFTNLSKIWILLLIFILSLLLNVVMYVTWTPVGMERICGIQGRYYTAILFLIFMCLIKKNNNWKINNLNLKIMIISTILNLITLGYVVINYL